MLPFFLYIYILIKKNFLSFDINLKPINFQEFRTNNLLFYRQQSMSVNDLILHHQHLLINVSMKLVLQIVQLIHHLLYFLQHYQILVVHQHLLLLNNNLILLYHVKKVKHQQNLIVMKIFLLNK
jgi:hypothetical protein